MRNLIHKLIFGICLLSISGFAISTPMYYCPETISCSGDHCNSDDPNIKYFHVDQEQSYKEGDYTFNYADVGIEPFTCGYEDQNGKMTVFLWSNFQMYPDVQDAPFNWNGQDRQLYCRGTSDRCPFTNHWMK